jgi:hypothetical protein
MPDVAVANLYSSKITVLFALDGGYFGNAVALTTGECPTSITIADFNHDRWSDVAVTNAYSGDVSVLLGTGGGNFARHVRYAVGGMPMSVVAADFDGDGNRDMAVANALSNDVSVLLGTGNGAFEPEVRYAAGHWPNSITVGQFDGEHGLDLAIANTFSDDVSVLLGYGDGGFATQNRIGAGSQPRTIATGKIDDDDRADLIVVNGYSEDLSILLNRSFKSAAIDIKPGNDSNNVNPDSRGSIKVVVLGGESVDVEELLTDTLRFGPMEAKAEHDLSDGLTYNDHLRDVNFDGVLDLVVHFRMRDTGIACSDQSATLSAELLSGWPIEGTDVIRTVGCQWTRAVRESRLNRESVRPAYPSDRVEDERVE